MEPQIKHAEQTFRSSGILLHPTDTVWGLGCDPYDQKAVDKIFALKERPKNLPLLLIVHSIEALIDIVGMIHPKIDQLLTYTDRPISIVVEMNKKSKLASGIISDDGTVCLRVVKQGLTHDLLRHLDSPMVSTSANIHGADATHKFEDLDARIIDSVDYILPDPEQRMTGKPSTIIRYNPDSKEFDFLR